MEDYKETAKYIVEIKQIFFSRTKGPISTKLDAKHSWVKGIKVCSNEKPQFFPRGDYKKLTKIHDEIKKSSSPHPVGQFQQNLAQSMIQVCSNEGPRPFPREDNYEIEKIHWRN